MTRPRLRIVHVIQNLNYGGMEKLLADLVCRIDRDRFESHVVNLEYAGRFSKEMEGSAQVHLCPPMSRLSLVRPSVLARFLGRIAPDIVHTHSGVWYKASLAAAMARVKSVVHTEHGQQAEDWRSRFLDRRAAHRTSAVVAVSQALGEYLSKRLAMPRGAIRVIPNGVDTARFAPRQPSGALRRELGLGPGQPIVGSIGRLEPVKGYEVVIRAFSALRSDKDEPEPVLVVAGEGSARAALERLANDLGVSHRVFLLGWRDDPEDLLAHFGCFVMGSWSEGTSVSLLEAMASGVAPVVTAVGGNTAVLGEEMASQAVPAGETEQLAHGIERALDGVWSRHIGRLARQRVESGFSLPAMVRAYEDLYQGLQPAHRADIAANDGGIN